MKTKNCIENRNLLFPYSIAEEIDNENGLERFSEVKENHILNSIDCLAKTIDARDGIYGNDTKLNRLMKLVDNAIKENTNQYHKNLRQQKLLDEVITLWPKEV